MTTTHRLGPPLEGPAPELIESGFALENADAPLLHAGLNLADLARRAAALRGDPAPVAADVELVDARGPGHGLPSPEGEAAAAVALRAAGLVLDPVYTAKALAALPAVAAGHPALFWHTGGLLDAVAGWLGAAPPHSSGAPR
jgi:1-aminocyclopropane-1-carboxylate deaminase/D-cysteine desulfhydrase-like pyridoxal-dependent ACC family enzyme